mmetsp:Transcript_36196/g.55584  ORF Transcript_36196/g.55584 Transcript_36196/m.55584 type:complete len:304 (+) Transcript_36196:178-1089(+)
MPPLLAGGVDALLHESISVHGEHLVFFGVRPTEVVVVGVLLHEDLLPERVPVEVVLLGRLEESGPGHELLSSALPLSDHLLPLALNLIDDVLQPPDKVVPVLIRDNSTELVSSRVVREVQVHVTEVVATMLFVELFLQTHDQVVVLDRICNLEELLRDLPVVEQVGHFRPVVHGLGGHTIWLRRRDAHFGLVGRVTSQVRLVDDLVALAVDLLLKRFFLEHGVVEGALASLLGIYHYFHLPRLLNGFLNLGLFVHAASFIVNSTLLVKDVDVNDIVLMELLRPTLGDSVLHLVLQHFLVRAPC